MWRSIRRLQPWVGVVLLGLGGFIGLLALSRGDLKSAAPALVAVGGVSLIARATYGAQRWILIAVGLGLALALYALTQSPIG